MIFRSMTDQELLAKKIDDLRAHLDAKIDNAIKLLLDLHGVNPVESGEPGTFSINRDVLAPERLSGRAPSSLDLSDE